MPARGGAFCWPTTHYTRCERTKGHCDAVAVRPQASSSKIRLLEIKAKPEKTSNLQQTYDRTGRAVVAVLGDCELVPELHVKPLPKSSQRYRYAPVINGRKMSVTLWVHGKRV